jgi:hypothetical protein
MLVFIDESGCPGFKIDSSPFLVVSMVIFHDYNEADRARNRITNLLQQTRVKPEFRFSKCKSVHREAFFEGMADSVFQVRAIVMEKKRVESHHLRNHPSAFYNYTLKQLISRNGLQDALIRIDGNAKKEFSKAAATYFRRQAPAGSVKKVRFVDSCAEPLIQLADMVSGAIGRPLLKPEAADCKVYRNLIKSKIANIWHFK